MQSFDVIVVGGSLVGASLALALARADLAVALVEPQAPRTAAPDDRSWDSRIYALSPGNAAWLTELAIWRLLPAERLVRVEAMQIFGDRAEGRLDFTAYDAGLRELAWIAENRVLQGALWQALESDARVSLHCPARCADIAWTHEQALITLEGGRELGARLVVGADGGDSWVRERAGIAVHVHDYREMAVVANFAITRPHEGTAYQWFRHDGVLALLPLPGARVSMVWSAPEARARELLAMPAEELAREVEAAAGGVTGALELVTAPASFPLKLQHVAHLIAPRTALVGDAAHNVHPLAGQGMNLGLRDARELAAVLSARGPHGDCGAHALLRRFERARKEDIAALELTTDGLEKLFSRRSVWVAGLRNMGLALVDAQPVLKNLLIRHAVA